MITTVTKSAFHDAFRDMDRKENFSYDALNLLYDYFQEYEESCDTSVELDVIAICCDFTEYSDYEDLKEVYDMDNEYEMDEFKRYIKNNAPTVLEKEGTLVIANF